MERILQGHEFLTEDIINRRKDGTEFNAELRVYPLMDHGTVQYFIGMQTDITLRKRVDKAKSEFVSLASHQLRTPLTAFRWGLGVLRKTGPLNPKQEEIAEDIQKAAAHMAESIDVMLQLSRLEAGKVQVKSTSFRLSDVINELCTIFHPQAKLHNHSCNFQMDENITLTTDSALLREILSNLITNAIKYSPDGGTITLTTKIADKSVQISVSDTGYGIPHDQQEKIFSKFFRATNVLGKIPDGTGLGLYLVHSLVELLGGTISMVSVENQGSTFTVTLPLSPPSP
ncbi:MAG: ATP-binding protein [Candidatus Peribacteraceae bacterium]|nr:ATP-binding protein [Candidatus Peribacteraceae bacterium]